MIIYAMQNETVDALAYRIFGKTKGIVEIIYQNNPMLCELPAMLPMGTALNVPETVPEPEKKRLNLWD
ncbi:MULTISPECIES: tail protein X [unclassified Gilliamella]|uniref:tail protein X n=1 Tax=unclassified Gilliamella TaxID=2685620 RepID=UPI00157FEBE7|nr:MULTISPECIES: tail protein X [unclassified Gilliamella]MCO6549565.1 tail protein X [Gilliamella sp.]MCO6557637.1 tail protein X [Gilliamella sp.]NUF27019.1 phage tail protein [Gilliamella sp. ESL0254]